MTMNDLTGKNGAAYYRVSSKGQAEKSLTPPEYRQECIDCAKRLGINLPEDRIFYDAGATGTNLDRPEMQALIATFEKIRGGALIFPMMSRLTRDRGDGAELAKLLAEYSITPITTDGKELEVDTPAGRFLWNMFVNFEAYNKDTLLSNMARGQAGARRQGYWPKGEPPMGFTTGPDGDHRVLVQREDEYDVLHRTADWSLDWAAEKHGTGLAELERRMRDEGIVGRNGKPYLASTMRQWFDPKNTYYVGKLPVAEVLRHEPIFTPEKWAAVTKVFDRARTGEHRGRWAKDFALFGLANCPVCGGRLGCRTERTGKYRYPMYACRERERGNGCTFKPIKRDLIDGPLMAMLRARLLEVSKVDTVAREAAEREKVHTERGIEKVKKDLDAIDNTIKAATEEYGKSGGSIPLIFFQETVGKLNDQRLEVARRLADLNSRLAEFSPLAAEKAYEALAQEFLGPQGVLQPTPAAVNLALRRVGMRFELRAWPTPEADYIWPLAPGRDPASPIAQFQQGDTYYTIVPTDWDGEVGDGNLVWDPDLVREDGEKGGYRQIGPDYATTAAIPVTISSTGAGSHDGREKCDSV